MRLAMNDSELESERLDSVEAGTAKEYIPPRGTTVESNLIMSDNSEFDVEPLLPRYELLEIEQSDWPIPEKRKVIAKAVEEVTDDEPADFNQIVGPALRWENSDGAMLLFCGHVAAAGEKRTKGEEYQSIADVEAALIERFATPAYNENEVTESELVETMIVLVRASPISNLEPEKWRDDERARRATENAIEEHVGELSSRGRSERGS